MPTATPSIFPPSMRADRSPAAAVDMRTQVRKVIRNLLENTPSFQRLSDADRHKLANGMVRIGEELVAPGGQIAHPNAQVRALAGGGSQASSGYNTDQEGKFTAQGAREGAAVAGALLQAVNFPDFCAGLINGVF